MDSRHFDRLTRRLSRNLTRRGALAGAGGLFLARRQQTRAAQLGPSTCGASGDVCTMLVGCCSGLTCVTSAINTNYGVCVPGDGGTIAAGTGLISPFSDEIETELAAIADAATTTESSSTTEPTQTRADRNAAKKDDKAAKLDARRTRQQERKARRRDRRARRREANELRKGPQLDFELLNAGGAGGRTETLRVTNNDDDSVTLTRIELLDDPDTGTSLSLTLEPGASYRFYSRNPEPDDDSASELAWININVCGPLEGDGYKLYASLSLDTQNKEFAVLCSSAAVAASSRRARSARRERNRGTRTTRRR